MEYFITIFANQRDVNILHAISWLTLPYVNNENSGECISFGWKFIMLFGIHLSTVCTDFAHCTRGDEILEWTTLFNGVIRFGIYGENNF